MKRKLNDPSIRVHCYGEAKNTIAIIAIEINFLYLSLDARHL